MKFLPEILALQRDLVERFQNVPEAEYQSIRGFIDSHSSGRTLPSQEVRTPVSGGSRVTPAGGGGSSGPLGAFRRRMGCHEPRDMAKALLQPHSSSPHWAAMLPRQQHLVSGCRASANVLAGLTCTVGVFGRGPEAAAPQPHHGVSVHVEQAEEVSGDSR